MPTPELPTPEETPKPTPSYRAVSNEDPVSVWSLDLKTVPGSFGISIGDGSANTKAVIQMLGPTTAAGLAAGYAGGGKADWYLPSKDELNALYLQRGVVPGLTPSTYWTSSGEYYFAWFQDFSTGSQDRIFKDRTFRVRPIRAF